MSGTEGAEEVQAGIFSFCAKLAEFSITLIDLARKDEVEERDFKN